jgi:two-component system, cell cycle response regulator CtrA
MFLTYLYGGVHEPQIKIIDVFVCMLRKKARPGDGWQPLYRDHMGRGYVLRDPAPPVTRAKNRGALRPGVLARQCPSEVA